MHSTPKYLDDRAYLITDTFFYTTDTGRTWGRAKAPTPPNTLGAQVIHFYPNTDNLFWTGNRGCSAQAQSCHAEAQCSRVNGQKWSLVDSYVRNCAWAKDVELNADPNEIICESYRDKKGNQRFFQNKNLMELVTRSNYYANKRKVFDHVGFPEFLVVAEVRRFPMVLLLR